MKKLNKKKNYLRLISFLFACFIWVYVVSSAEIEVNKSIPIEVEVPKNMAIKNFYEQEVQFRIKGPGIFVRKFLERELVIAFNAKDYYRRGVSEYRLGINPGQIKLPLGVELVDLQPRRVFIDLEKSMQKAVPVEWRVSEEFKQEHGIVEMKLSPDKVRIRGPRSLVKKVTQIELVAIDKSMLNEERRFKVPFKPLDPRLELDTKQAEMSYTKQSNQKEFTFSQVPIIFQSVKLISQVSPKVVDVTLKGELAVLEKLDQDKIKVIADVPSKLKGKTEVELSVVLPDTTLELVSINPRVVKMVLE